MADTPDQPAATQAPNATDPSDSPLEWLKKKLGMSGSSATGNKSEDEALAEEDGAHSSTTPSNSGRGAQSTDAQNQY